MASECSVFGMSERYQNGYFAIGIGIPKEDNPDFLAYSLYATTQNWINYKLSNSSYV